MNYLSKQRYHKNKTICQENSSILWGHYCFSYCSWPPVQQKGRLLIGLNRILFCFNKSSQIIKWVLQYSQRGGGIKKNLTSCFNESQNIYTYAFYLFLRSRNSVEKKLVRLSIVLEACPTLIKADTHWLHSSFIMPFIMPNKWRGCAPAIMFCDRMTESFINNWYPLREISMNFDTP